MSYYKRHAGVRFSKDLAEDLQRYAGDEAFIAWENAGIAAPEASPFVAHGDSGKVLVRPFNNHEALLVAVYIEGRLVAAWNKQLKQWFLRRLPQPDNGAAFGGNEGIEAFARRASGPDSPVARLAKLEQDERDAITRLQRDHEDFMQRLGAEDRERRLELERRARIHIGIEGDDPT